jgi:hypothetical protein
MENSPHRGHITVDEYELWVIDVAFGRTNVFRQPPDATYRETFVTTTAERMTIEALPGGVVDLSQVLA